MNHLLTFYGLIVGALSAVTFIAYGIDKRAARKNKRRISEAHLQLLAALGGWPGAWVGQRVFRHKTQKFSFRVVFWLIVASHLILLGGLVYMSLGGES